ncbi:MAG: chitobiase/beta-hexosaminidase C-terminal domain-containing protein [Parasporobacterium sp.]|nr:chitobiase/beta-hexosaminidase C-terminal domain-containing protein [Parasporobacterium sp.]
MKVTADYDYIQAEIANKVDRFFYEDRKNDTAADKEDLDLNLFVKSGNNSLQQDDNNRINDGNRKSVNRSDDQRSDGSGDFAKTKNIYGNDSIFNDEEEYGESPDPEYDEPVRKEKRRPERRTNERPPVRNVPRRHDRPLDDADYYGEKDQTTAKILTVLIIFVIIAACAIGVMAITGVFRTDKNADSRQSQLTSLSSNIVAGQIYKAPLEVQLTNAYEGNVFYTLDGTEPSIDSKMYTGPFVITPNDVANTYPAVNLRAVSFSPDSEKTGDLNITFEFEYEEGAVTLQPETELTSLQAPVISPASGSYSSDMSITVESPDGADIYYTYDGTAPTVNSAKYTGPVKMIPGSTIFAAVCISGDIESPMSSASYVLEYDYDISSNQAIELVKNVLIWNYEIADYDGNTYEGGKTYFFHKGVYTIDEYTYYIIEADTFDAEGAMENISYLGVGVNYGTVNYVEPSGASYSIVY